MGSTWLEAVSTWWRVLLVISNGRGVRANFYLVVPPFALGRLHPPGGVSAVGQQWEGLGWRFASPDSVGELDAIMRAWRLGFDFGEVDFGEARGARA